MQLLHCRPVPTTEFACLSLVWKDKDSMGDLMTVACPFTTMSLSTASTCLRELHEYVNSVYEISKKNKEIPPKNTENGDEPTGSVSQQFRLDESTVLEGPLHVFRPKQGHGVGLHYCVATDTNVLRKCASIFRLDSVEALVGVLLCVGVSGLSYAHSSLNSLERRMQDCLTILETKPCDEASVKTLLSTLILTDDEERKTNTMVDAENVAISDLESQSEASTEKLKSAMSPIGAVRKTKRGQGRARLKGDTVMEISETRLAVTAESSADMARITAERLAVLSVAEKESELRKYETTGLQRRSSMKFGKRSGRRRSKSGNEADLDDFDCRVVPKKPQQRDVPALRPPGADTQAISPTKTTISPKKAALPTLLAPRNDVASRRGSQRPSSKRWSMGNGSSRRGNLTPSSSVDLATPRGEAAFNAFAVDSSANEPLGNSTFPAMQQFGGVSSEQSNSASMKSNMNGGDPWGLIVTAPTTEFNNTPPPPPPPEAAPGFDPFGSPLDVRKSAGNVGKSPSQSVPKSPSPRRVLSDQDTRTDETSALHRLLATAGPSGLTDDDVSRGEKSATSYPNEWIPPANSDLRDAYNELDELVAKATPAPDAEETMDNLRPRLMVNVALNEDLTCSYRQSKMSSCTIEGVVQVQVSCEARDGVPFFLLVRDPSRHIKMVQENRRFAEDMTEVLSEEDIGVDHKYTVSVPSADSYFPVMRYKCSSELRPVPIRVQTRVRLNDAMSCRVALQISSNPANEDDLTDLTIVMGVPTEVRGETLTTTPPGGVWNAAKRSVIWCVAELGDGEKFQLQAEFGMNPDAHSPTGEKPKFPVLVRCQCMYAQLSDIELEVADIPEVFPADVAMKLARRFRLSHRERS